jgi:hypothetical protein
LVKIVKSWSREYGEERGERREMRRRGGEWETGRRGENLTASETCQRLIERSRRAGEGKLRKGSSVPLISHVPAKLLSVQTKSQTVTDFA